MYKNVITKYQQPGRFYNLKHTGRRKKLSDIEIRHLKRLVKGYSRLSASKIAMDLNSSLLQPRYNKNNTKIFESSCL